MDRSRPAVTTLAALVCAAPLLWVSEPSLIARHELNVVLAWVGALALLFGALPLARPSRELTRALVAVLVLAGVVAISLAWTVSAERTSAELARVAGYVVLLGLVALGVGRGTWRAVAGALAAVALAACAVAVASRLFPGGFDDLGRTLATGDRHVFPFGYSNALASWAAMSLAIAVAYAANLRDPERRAWWLAAAPVAGTALYLTLSRGGIAAAALGLALIVVLARDRVSAMVCALGAVGATACVVLAVRSQPDVAQATGGGGGPFVLFVLGLACCGCWFLGRSLARGEGSDPRPRGLLVASLGLAALAAGLLLAGDEVAPAESSPAGSDPAARLVSLEGARPELWSAALDAWSERPLGGTGAGTFEFVWGARSEDAVSVRDAHSLPIESLAELGLAGALAVVAFLGLLLAAAVRGWRAARSPASAAAGAAMLAAFAAYLAQVLVDWTWEVGAVAFLGLGSGAVVAASRSAPAARAWPGGLRSTALAALAVLAGAVQVPAAVSADRLVSSLAQLAVGDAAQARSLAAEAIEAQPWAATPYAQRAIAALAADDLEEATSDAAAAVEREPENWIHHALLAKAHVARGAVDRAAKALARAQELSAGPQLLLDEVEDELRSGAGSLGGADGQAGP